MMLSFPVPDRQVAADEYASAQELKQQAVSAAAASEPESIPQFSPPALGPEDQGKSVSRFLLLLLCVRCK